MKNIKRSSRALRLLKTGQVQVNAALQWSITTAALLIAGASTSMTAAAWASSENSQQNSEQNYAIIGDAGNWNERTQNVRDSISRAGINNLILPGDNLYSGSYENAWNPWSGFEFSVVAIGNHHGGYSREVEFFKMPGEYFTREMPDGVRFIVLNSDNTATATEQAAFLESELEKEFKTTFLVWHHPSYTVTAFHPWQQREAFQLPIRKLIKKYSDRITALLMGHDHIGAIYCLDNLPLIISGAVWDTREPESMNYTAEDNVKVSSKWVYPANTPTWARLTISPSSSSDELDGASGRKIGVKFIKAADNSILVESDLTPGSESNVCRN